MESGHVAAGGDEVGIGVKAEAPVLLKVACVGGGDFEGRLKFEEADAQETFDRDGQKEPHEDDDREGGEGAGLVETAGRHGKRAGVGRPRSAHGATGRIVTRRRPRD